MTNPSSDAQVATYIQQAAKAAWNVDGISDAMPRRRIERVGIIGAGTMGGGISMNFASAGIPVTIVETKQEALERGLGVIQKKGWIGWKDSSLFRADAFYNLMCPQRPNSI